MLRSLTIVLLLVLHTTTATIDFAHLPEHLQKLSDFKSAAIHSAATKLKDLKETAAYNIQHLADDIDLNNLHKLDVLQIGPTLQKKYKLIKDLYNKPATKVNVVHIYGDELNSHFEHDHGKLVHHGHFDHDHAKLVHHGHHDHVKLVHHDHAKLVHHGHHDHHGHHGHHGHHHHLHDLPEWVLVGAHV